MNIERERAGYALEIVESLKDEKLENYVSYVKALPATILQNGLGQAMATLLAAAKGNPQDDHRRLYDHVEKWLCKKNASSPYFGQNNLMKEITTNNEAAYIHAQAETMAYLEWLKKFAVAYLTKPEPAKEGDKQ